MSGQNTVILNRKYRHFKGGIYKTMCLAQHSETGEELVIYCSADDRPTRIYARPVNMFESEVDHKKYPGIKQHFRFELLPGND